MNTVCQAAFVSSTGLMRPNEPCLQVGSRYHMFPCIIKALCAPSLPPKLSPTATLSPSLPLLFPLSQLLSRFVFSRGLSVTHLFSLSFVLSHSLLRSHARAYSGKSEWVWGPPNHDCGLFRVPLSTSIPTVISGGHIQVPPDLNFPLS